MKSLKYGLIVLVLVSLAAIAYAGENQGANFGVVVKVNLLASPADIKWGPAPPVVPKGAEATVLDGDPFKDGSSYTLRLKMPDGYKIPPHWHPTDENVTVIGGTLGAGMGDKFDPAKGQFMEAGGFVTMPHGMHHFAWAKVPTIIQVHGIGPFTFTYVNPTDDPRNQH
jgi:hypothetical protein